MERDLKGLIDTIDQKDKTESMLERKIEALKEEINRLKFTIREQKLLIQSLKETNNAEEEKSVVLDDDIQLLKEMIFTQRQEILKKDEKIQELQTKTNELDIIVPLTGDSDQYIDEIENLNKKISKLIDQLEKYKSNENNTNRIIKELSEQVEFSNKELEELRSYNENLKSEKIDDDQLGDEENLIEKNNDLLSEISEYQTQILDLQTSLESIENASKEEKEKSNDIINQLRLEKEEEKIEINNLRKKIKNFEKLDMKNDLITNIDGYYELEKQYENQMKRLESENKAYQVELESLRTQMREFQNAQGDSEENQQRLYEVESTEIIKSLKQEKEELREALSQLNAEKMKLEQHIIQSKETNAYNLNVTDENISSIIRELKQENQQLIQDNREIKTRLSIKSSDEAELKQIIEGLKIKIHKLKTKLEVEILEKDFKMPKDSENQLYKEFLKSLDQNSIQHSIDNLVKDIESNKSYDVKKNSLYILATLKNDKVKNLFLKLITDKDWLIRFHLIKAIEKTRNLEYRDILIKLSKDKDVDVREAAKDVLSKL